MENNNLHIIAGVLTISEEYILSKSLDFWRATTESLSTGSISHYAIYDLHSNNPLEYP